VLATIEDPFMMDGKAHETFAPIAFNLHYIACKCDKPRVFAQAIVGKYSLLYTCMMRMPIHFEMQGH